MKEMICIIFFLILAFAGGLFIGSLTQDKQQARVDMASDHVEKIMLACWYYDIIHHPEYHESWTDKGKQMLKDWVANDFDAPLHLLPDNIKAWKKQLKGGNYDAN